VKEYYKISEISKLYGIGPDSLRYYEKIGVLRPRRGANGYRMYSLKEIYKLSILRDLRRLDFSVAQIKEYLDCQSVDNTLSMLRRERGMLAEQLRTLKAREQSIAERIHFLAKAKDISAGKFAVRQFPDRPCLQLNEFITRDEEMDFAVKKLHQKHEARIQDLCSQSIGAAVSLQDLYAGRENVFRSVFFLLPHGAPDADLILPAGEYLSYYYRGAYGQSPDRIREALAYAEQRNFLAAGNPFEIYHIDNRDTILPQEFLTEIQIPVKSAEILKAAPTLIFRIFHSFLLTAHTRTGL
jgi:DNA-binding transcriptional MerR regulator